MSNKREASADAYFCTAAIGSATAAMKAQRALASSAIPSSVTKLSSPSRRGCSYGIRFPCAQKNNVSLVLDGAGVRIRSFAQE